MYEKCPYCGGQNGLESSRIVRETVLFDWSGDSEVTTTKTISERSTGKCFDCGKKIDISDFKFGRLKI